MAPEEKDDSKIQTDHPRSQADDGSKVNSLTNNQRRSGRRPWRRTNKSQTVQPGRQAGQTIDQNRDKQTVSENRPARQDNRRHSGQNRSQKNLTDNRRSEVDKRDSTNNPPGTNDRTGQPGQASSTNNQQPRRDHRQQGSNSRGKYRQDRSGDNPRTGRQPQARGSNEPDIPPGFTPIEPGATFIPPVESNGIIIPRSFDNYRKPKPAQDSNQRNNNRDGRRRQDFRNRNKNQRGNKDNEVSDSPGEPGARSETGPNGGPPQQKSSQTGNNRSQHRPDQRRDGKPQSSGNIRDRRRKGNRLSRFEQPAGAELSGYSTYVSLVDRIPASRPVPSVPIPTDRGIKLRSQRGSPSKNWWARRWIDAMERLVDPSRLQRGRSYARSGQVLTIQETRGGIEALVQGSRPAPYKVVIQVTHLKNEQWSQVVDALSEQALFTAQLLAGEMPGNIESAFETAGVSLFPVRSGDLNSHCSCPDWANPCKHVAATHYILGDRFDDDPFLLFRMRGRTQEQILNELHQRRGGTLTEDEFPAEVPSAPPLEAFTSQYWVSAEDLDSFPLTITPPTVDMPIFKRLGEPAFLPGESLPAVLKPVYDSFTRSALRAAYTDEDPSESNSTEENGNGS